MGTARNFHVKTGLNVDAGDVTVTSGNLLLNAGYIDVDSLKLDGQTISTVTGDENINLTPHGTGSVVISKADINGGAIDSTAIGGTTAAAGTFTTLTASDLLDVNAGATITGDTTNEITLDIQGVASQSVDALRIRDSDGNVDLNVSNLGVTTTRSLVATTADINAGTVDAITSLTAAGDLDIGAYDLRAQTLTADALTATRVVFAGTDGVLSDDSDMTFSTDTLTVTKLGAYEQAGSVDFSDEAMTNVNIDSGAIDNTPVGANTASTGAFTTLAASGATTLSGAVTLGDATGDDITNTGRWVGDFVPKVDSSIDLGTAALRFAEAHIDTVTAGTAGGTVISNTSIVMEPSNADTLTIASTTNGVSNITTADGSGSLGATLAISSAGTMNLQYNGSTKLSIGASEIDITGSLDVSSTIYGSGFKSSLEQANAGEGIDLNSNATYRVKEDSGVYKDGNVNTHYTTSNFEETNFRSSVLATDTDGFTAANNVVVPLVFINLDKTSDNKYHSAEFHCAMQEKVTSGNVAKQWLSQKLKASYNGDTVKFQTSDSRWSNEDLAGSPPPGEFCAQKWTDGSDNFMVISYCPYLTTANTRTITYAVNANGLSMPIQVSA